MHSELTAKFPALPAALKDGRAVTLRLLQSDDGARLAEFYAAVPAADQRFYCPHPLEREHAFRNAARADDPCQIVVLAVAPEGMIAGYAWVRWKDTPAATGNFGICVRPDYQGGGAGRALMTRLFDMIRAAGPPRVRLTVQQANARGVALYKRMGFRIVEERQRHAIPALGLPAEPEYVMERAGV